jgi:hypothetical protein
MLTDSYHVSTGNVLELIDRAACAAASAGPWRDPECRQTFDGDDPERITGALGWVLAEAGVNEQQIRKTLAQLRDLPYNLWPAIEVDGARLFEPDLYVLRALEAACRTDPERAAGQARAAAGDCPRP